MALWDDYDDVVFQVVRNSSGQYSIWPTNRKRPHGWAGVGFTGSRRSCLDEIELRWTDAATEPADPVAATPTETSTAVAPEAGSFLLGAHRATPADSMPQLIRGRDLPADALAARCGPDRLSRGELLDTGYAWARALAEAGCGRETTVAVLLPRGLEALTAIFAVLDAGAAYVPLSCADPVERILAILEDCGTRVVITTDALADALRAYDGLVLTPADLRRRAETATARPEPARPDDLAYVFYTSGTTGEPKGVEGTHRQLVNYALWCRSAFAHRPGEVTFLTAPLFFLGSLTTIFTPLLEGWPIVVAPDGATTDDLRELAAAEQGGLLKVTPTHIRMMTARGVPSAGLARQLMVGSEPLTVTQELHRWMADDPQRVVVNHYGLTETHGCFCHWLTGTETIGSAVPIGTPIENVEAYIVDRDGELAAVGEVGELLVGGPSIGRGYRRRPARTAERWVPHPWGVNGARLLRTGDLARLGADGVVWVLGRADRQVKIRGHRVEPAALEEALRARPDVREALVLPRTADGKVTLDAYLVRANGAEVDPLTVRRELAASFPAQWIPSRLAVLTEFPVNANGKVDVQALPVPPPVHEPDRGQATTERWSRMDRVVAEAFCAVLEIDDIGLSDNFYELGGDSLRSLEVAVRVGDELGWDVPAPDAATATVRSYAESIASAQDFPDLPAQPVSSRSGDA